MVVTVQICALLWKNLKTKTRSPGTIIGEIVIPILMCALIANEKLISHKTKGVKRYEPHSVSANLSNDRLVELVYVPTSPAIRKLLLSSNSTATIFKKLISFKSVNEAYKYTSKKYLSYPPVKFDLDNISEVPTRLSYKVILDVDYEPGYQSAEAIQYMDFCVTVLQTEISRAFTSYWAARRSISVEYGKLMIQRMPETTSISTTGIETKYVLYVFWPLMYVWLFTITINYLVNDRKYMIKISLSMLGVTDKVFWLSWFITSLTSGVIVAVIVTITYCTDYSEDGQVIETKASLFAIIQLVYIINTISSAFLLSHVIFFVEELVFALSLVYYVSCTVLSLSAVTYFLSRVQMFIIGTFLYQTGFYIVVQDIYNKEYLGRGINYANMFINEKAPHTTVSDGLIIMCLNTAVNFLLMWYIRNVFPDHHGNPQPYYFCFTRSYWRLEGCPEIPALPQSEEHLFESVPRRLTPVISSRGLMKLVNDEPVVAGVSINLYRSEVTVIVGNKYSGKTTLINLLAGIIPASSGVVTINGHNVAKERRRLNHITGYCTQHDVLFRKLTCLEHLTFYLKLKGHYSAHYENWNSELLRCIGLGEQSDNYPWMLNVGERRKLTIACSFVGENQIIFLDEPTYGLNAKAKKDVCHFLQNMKQGRTILMSTHSMDEAETLADRIAIIEEGGLKCYGSPAFLKRIFGVGYHLKVTREPGCSIKNLLKTVQTIFPEATFSGSNSTEVTISLPEGLDFFIPNFLEQLDKRTDDLKISNIRLSAFSLYDVFHGLGEGFELRENIDSAHSSICETMEEQNEFDKDGFLSERLFKRMGNYEQYTGSRLILQQLKAIFFKKWILFTRPLITALAILFLPAGVVLFGIGLDQDTMSASDVKPLEFSLRGLEDTLIPIWKNDSTAKAKLDSYEKQFQSVGSHVMSPSQKDPNEFFIYWANKYDDERYNKKFIFGVELTIPDTTIIFYQHWMTQAQGVAVQIMINSEIVTALGENYSVQTGVEYVQSFEEQLYLKMQVKTIACIAIVMCLVPLLLVTEVIFERTNGARHLQSVSGVNTCVFWLGTYIFDLLVYLFVAATIVLALMYSPEYYIRCGHWNATITLLLVFGLTVFPYLYAFQSVFYTAITGSITMLIYNTFMGLLMSMVIALTKIYAQSMKDYLGLIDNLLGAVSPNYLLSYSLLTLVSRTVKSTVNGTCVSHSWPNETRLILNMEMFVVQFIISWLMIACVEYEIYSKYILPMYLSVCCSKDKNKAAPYMFCQDQEVNDEGARVETLAQSPESNNEVLLMVNVEKTYSNCYYTNRAVYPTSLGMSPNESFGLLGKSNSGKTSILKMIIGDTQPTAGDIYVLKHNVKTELTKASTKLGYCPENNALHDMLTGRETLYLYGRIRGVPDRSLEDVVEVVIDFITLRPYENKVVRRYSHNNKRKLSLGIAIMGKPVLLVLDMPTVGMGRMSRRIMWNVLHLIQISGHSLIIATRSIEECEALCMRMAFMLNGRLITIGSPQDLKLRYGQGYWVVLQLNVTKSGSSKILDDVIVFLHRTVQSTHVTSVAERVIIREADSCEIHYPQPVSLVSLFRSLILAKERFNLRAFSVQQLTLRHIFLMLINDRASF